MSVSDHLFATSILERTTIFSPEPRLVAERLEYGQAFTRFSGSQWLIDATDQLSFHFDGSPSRLQPHDADWLRAPVQSAVVVSVPCRVTSVTRRRVLLGEDLEVRDETSFAVVALRTPTDEISFVSDFESIDFYARLYAPELSKPAEHALDVLPDLPIVFRNGSGAVLLHEAIGHASEHHAVPAAWPSWIRVTDATSGAIDDIGLARHEVSLIDQPPESYRRNSFRDVPDRRMMSVDVRCEERPITFGDYIAVHLVSAGSYDALSDNVTVEVSLGFITIDGDTRRVAPFSISMKRADIARRLAGSTGGARPYPGVICSSGGQTLYVGSKAPDLVLTGE